LIAIGWRLIMSVDQAPILRFCSDMGLSENRDLSIGSSREGMLFGITL
jgi:hypothetical protein